MKGDRKSRG